MSPSPCPPHDRRTGSGPRESMLAAALGVDSMTSEADPQPNNFENALAELESLVDTLEKGELTLEQSLTAFERGIKLTSTCRKALDSAEQKVRILTAESPDAEPVSFESHD